ncbi:hypothetical protein NQ317_006693 [Molorchus minor]|uniref:Uncharacterized protein n=1 Tax=Molorchus minor TaxID=1323400 RepID=A0ABQ9JVW1_9CUCU|nr:hypothetical protein NQ317_006693 [Molorchus minor]
MNDEDFDDVDPDDAVSPTDSGAAAAEPLQRSHDSIPAVHSYQIKPSLEEKFKEVPVKEIMRNTVSTVLTGKNI